MRTLFLQGWEFSKQPLHTDYEEMERRTWEFEVVGLPHDWLIEQTDNLYQDSTGWYRKTFLWKKKQSERVFLEFDGIYMDSKIYLNGSQIGEWKYGYSAFEVELTGGLRDGENQIWVRVDYQSPNSRWYTGAGIYRNLWLKVTGEEYMVRDGVYFSAKREKENQWKIEIETEVQGNHPNLLYEIREKGADSWQRLEGLQENIGKGKQKLTCYMENPKLWSTETPFCYELKISLEKKGEILQEEVQNVGFRTMEFSPEEGFLLNGKKVKLKGCCEHHDLGCLGAAYHDKAMRRKLSLLKEMGVNALRTAHNMPAREVMDLGDEMGILILSEAFDMWEESKNPYDYARFFPEWYKKDVASWVRRDRNHPCLMMWSIGNEIHDTHGGEKGMEWMKKLMDQVRLHDSKGNGALTLGSNYMPWENTQKCADIIGLIGYNYGEKYYKEHHQQHPGWIIYGSETGSVVQSRGIYHFPYSRSVLADVDEQCSALGNSTTSWGAQSAEACVKAEKECRFSCGQFLWTGFDYIGEPTPYHTKNSYFGQLDTAGFPKDSYYIYQSGWTDYRLKPMIHIFPYWDFNRGQEIDVRICSNAPLVELFVNGKSQGKCHLDQKQGTKLAGHWKVPYEEGEIRGKAYDEEGHLLAEAVRHSFGEGARICLCPEEDHIKADGEDLLFIRISVVDKEGYPVENANNRIHIKVEGQGNLAGTDNGDSTDLDCYKSSSRRLFSGKLLAVIKAGQEPGIVRVRVVSEGLPEAVLEIPAVQAVKRPGISPLAYLPGIPQEEEMDGEIPVRNLYLESEKGLTLTPDNPETKVHVRICPENAWDREVCWSIVDDGGIPVNLGEIRGQGENITLRAISDGTFRLRCMSKCGTEKIRIISQLEFTVSGFGKAFTNPYAFVSAGLYDWKDGEIGNGNQHGVATARGEESGFGFRNLDFGPYGSDEITIPIFALTAAPYRIRLYQGSPKEGGELLADVIYQKPSIWHQYQPETYKLKKRIRGISQLYFLLEDKVHIKGFSFTKYERAWQKLWAGECDKIYGDSFERKENAILHIGNNVTIEYSDLDFGQRGTQRLILQGNTPLEKSSVLLSFTDGMGKEERQLVEYYGGKEEEEFRIPLLKGCQTLRLIFLPGARFDFYSLQFFEKEK